MRQVPCCLGQLRQVGRLNGGGGAVAVQLLLDVVDGAEREARPVQVHAALVGELFLPVLGKIFYGVTAMSQLKPTNGENRRSEGEVTAA